MKRVQLAELSRREKMLLHDRMEGFWYCMSSRRSCHKDKTPKGPYLHTPTEPKRPESRKFYNYS